jgi:perosamine synthetase
MGMIPLYKPFMPNLPELDTVLNSGQLAYGKYGKLLEAKLSDFIGNPYSLVTNNYSNAILLALLTLGIKKGDKVVISPLVCLATSQPITSLGAELVFCDINLRNGGIDADLLREILSTQEISCVVVTHYAGIVADIDGLSKLCKEYNVPVIEDGSDAFGSKYKDSFIGNTGFDVTVFSFSAVRNPNLIDAGGITFVREELYNRAYLIRDAGINRKTFRNSLGEIDLSSDIYLPGISATLDELRCYIGIKQFEVLDGLIRSGQSNLNQVHKVIEKFNEIEVIFDLDSLSNGWIIPVKSTRKIEIIKELKSIGVISSSVHGNISNYSIYGNKLKMTNADKFLNSFLALPSGWWIEDIGEYLSKLEITLSIALKE